MQSKTISDGQFLDWIASLRGRDRKVERDAKKNATLTARSSDAPVIAQRPIAPLQPIQSEEKRHVPMEMVSVTDAGAESVIIDEETNEVSAPVNRGLSIEEMAYGKSSRRASSTPLGLVLLLSQHVALFSTQSSGREILFQLWKRSLALY